MTLSRLPIVQCLILVIREGQFCLREEVDSLPFAVRVNCRRWVVCFGVLSLWLCQNPQTEF